MASASTGDGGEMGLRDWAVEVVLPAVVTTPVYWYLTDDDLFGTAMFALAVLATMFVITWFSENRGES